MWGSKTTLAVESSVASRFTDKYSESTASLSIAVHGPVAVEVDLASAELEAHVGSFSSVDANAKMSVYLR